MVKKILDYNFNLSLPDAENFKKLYTKVRRDSNFGAVFQKGPQEFIAIRDHFGIVPLYYRKCSVAGTKWSFNYTDLLEASDCIDESILKKYLGLPTTRLFDLVPDIKIVPPGSVIRVADNHVTLLYTYRVTSQKRLTHSSKKAYLQKLEQSLETALDRIILEKEVGLYLSGGMDSGLLGCLLQRRGIIVNAYTALPWGKEGTEYNFAKINATKIGTQNHSVVDVSSGNILSYLSSIIQNYGTPHGSSTAINVSAIWEETDIRNEKQVFFAQGLDTFTGSVSGQSNVFFFSKLPFLLRKKISSKFLHKNPIVNFLRLTSGGVVDSHKNLTLIPANESTLNKLSLAGIYVGYTPTDCESLNGPSIKSGQLISNPYYDVDLIEFYLSVPLRYKIGIKFGSKTILSIEKKMFREIALKYLPKELVIRKKGFTLAQKRSAETRSIFAKLNLKHNLAETSDSSKSICLEVIDNLKMYIAKI